MAHYRMGVRSAGKGFFFIDLVQLSFQLHCYVFADSDNCVQARPVGDSLAHWNAHWNLGWIDALLYQ
jgi:hypothetical protein